MRSIICYVILLVSATFSTAQGIRWDDGTWDDLLKKALLEKKLIFVDVYTSWCRPCIQMEREVFSDNEIGTFFNKTFISVKIDAEDNNFGTWLAHKYGVSLYPALLFVDNQGALISTFTGYQNKHELLNLSRQTTELFVHHDFLQEVKKNLQKDYSLSEIRRILTVSLIHPFEGKENLVMKYLDQIDYITENDLRIVMGEIDKMLPDYIRRLSRLTTSLSYKEIYLRKNSKEWIKWKTDTELAIYTLLDKYKFENNLPAFEKSLEILKSLPGIKIRQIDNLYLSFYKQNNLEKYRTFAAYIIDEYIIPVRPEDVKKADEEKFKLLQEEVIKDIAAAMSVSSDVAIITEQNSATPILDSLSRIYTISKSIADQLYDISGDFYAFYEDPSSRRKASFWASLAYLYYPYEMKYFDNHIFILETTGNESEAKTIKEKVKVLPWYSEMKEANSF